ncbi:MAG TPA: acylphosphatase [Desulfobacteraceae bacterium]|nr:acylphosphatase [Desulfobacteraceae bacterium]
MTDISAIEVTITGRVQGVFFRAETRNAAISRDICGYVKNMADGTVQAVFQGSADQLTRMLAWCETGAPLSRVDKVDSRPIPYQSDLVDFQIRY